MQRAQDEVAGLGGGEGDLHCVAIANFTEQDHLGGLAQGRPQAGRKIGKILSQFALAENGLLVSVHEFDRVFERDDVHFLRLVNLVEHRSQGGGFAAAGAAGEEDDPEFFLDHSLENGRQTERF